MIGFSSIWPKLFFLLVFCGFLTAFIKSWSEVAKKKEAVTGKLLFLSAFFLLWGFMITQLFVREALFHHDLSALRVEALKSIEVGNLSINAPEDISKVVRSLNDAQWFEVNHGGWAAEMPLVLHFRSGQCRTYHVALCLRQEGAVVISMSNFDRNGEGTGWSNGVVFCPRLPDALAVNGINLPGEKTEWRVPSSESDKAASGRWHVRIAPLTIFGFITLGALRVFFRLVKRISPGSKTTPNFDAQSNVVATIGGLALVSIIAAGCGLRVLYALFDWPDPTNSGAIISVWLLLLGGGTILVLQRHRKLAN